MSKKEFSGIYKTILLAGLCAVCGLALALVCILVCVQRWQFLPV